MTYLDYKITDKKESLDPDLTAKPLSAVNLRELINQCNKSLTPLITELSQNPSNYNCLLDTKNQLNSILHRYPENSLVNWQKEFIKASDSFNSDRILELTKIWPQIIDQFKIQLAS